MHLIVLNREQVELAAWRFQRHGNSPARIARHFRGAGDARRLGLCRALGRLERQYAINLGTVCYKFLEKETRPAPQVQHQVMDYVAGWRDHADGSQDLVVSVERIREIDRLAEGDAEWISLHDS
ncbi:MAG: hypothetical protein ABR559_04070 [Gemmatimonadota bacterium]